jgi:biopolymer transport protein TolR
MHASARALVHAQPNVTPMIDVMLVLLIIFMAVGPLLEAGFRVVPPTGQHLTRHPDEPADAVIGLDAQGRLFFNKSVVTQTELRQRLHARFTASPTDRVVYVRADEGLAFNAVQTVMDLAAGEGARVVGLVSAPEAHTPTPR